MCLILRVGHTAERKKMSAISYDLFNKKFKLLPDKYQTLIFQLLQDMEHTVNVNPKDLLYKRGFTIALKEHDLSINKLAKIIDKKNNISDENDVIKKGKKKGDEDNAYCRDAIATLIERGYKGSRSAYLDVACEILEIDEIFLINNSEYLVEHTQNIKWCFETISDINQLAIYNLMSKLENIECLNPTFNDMCIDIQNVGIEIDT